MSIHSAEFNEKLYKYHNITLTRSAYHFQFDMVFVSTNAVLVRKSRRTVGAHKLKAPLCKGSCHRR